MPFRPNVLLLDGAEGPFALLEKKTLALADAAVSTDGAGSFSGYASLWDIKDSQGDIVVRGAYADTIPQFIQRGFIGWSHDWAEPVATIREAKEDDRGLFIVADFHSDSQSQVARTRTAERLARGKFMGLSIGYQTDDSETTDSARLLKKITLFETSLVTVPALAPAGVTAAKTAEEKQAVPGSFEDRQEMVARAVMARYGSQDSMGDTTRFAYPVATFSDRVVVCIYGGEAEDYREVDYTIDGDTVTLGNERPVDLQTTIVPKGLDFPDHSERVRVAVREWVARVRVGSTQRQKEGRAISEARRGRMATVRDQLRVGADEIDGMLAETEPKPKEIDPAIRAEFLRYQRLRARQYVGV